MPTSPHDMQLLAEQVAEALSGADLEAFSALLDPDVTWGAPGVDTPACRNRQQVVRWYREARDAGMRGDVQEVTIHGDRLLVALMISRDAASHASHSSHSVMRWQLLTVVDVKVVDIVGFDSRDEALDYQHVTTC